jgi:membrane protease YdiL (CAAX protease family)
MSNDSSKEAKPAKTKSYPWSPLTAFLIVMLSFLFLPVIAQLQVSFYPTLMGWDEARVDEWVLNSATANFFYVLLTEALTVAVLFWFTTHKRIAFRVAAALGKFKLRDILHAVLGFVAYFGLFYLALVILTPLLPIDVDQEQALGFTRGIGGTGLTLAFISLVILPPIVEEIVFRGFFYGSLRAHKIRKWTSIIVTSVFFGALHLFGAAEGGLLWIAFIDTFILSLVMCYLREENGTIWASIGVHALKNGFVFVNLFIINTY